MEQNLISHYLSVRSYRPKGFDKARILQVVLLVAICIWLLYLINNSHHKQENESKNLSIMNLTTNLGRKGFAEYTTRAKAKTRGKNALGELESGENAAREYEIDVNIDEGTDQSVLKLEEEEDEDEEEESTVLNGKREATEAEFLLKKLYNISVDDNGGDAFRVEAFPDENGIPPDAEESTTDPRGAEPKNLDSRINESRNPIGHRR